MEFLFQLCHDGVLVKCEDNTYVKCNATVSNSLVCYSFYKYEVAETAEGLICKLKFI